MCSRDILVIDLPTFLQCKCGSRRRMRQWCSEVSAATDWVVALSDVGMGSSTRVGDTEFNFRLVDPSWSSLSHVGISGGKLEM